MDINILKNLKGTFAAYSEKDMNQICSPLELVKIHHFHFMKYFKNGEWISITKNRKWLEHFYSNKLYQYSHFTKSKKYQNGATLWSDINEPSVIREAA